MKIALTFLIPLLVAAGVVQAQSGITAGQTTGLRHVRPVSPIALTSQLTYAAANTPQDTHQLHSLDVDEDGQPDLFLLTDATLQAGKYPIAFAQVRVQGGEVLKTQTAFQPTAVALAGGAAIADSPQPFVAGSTTPTWAPAIVADVAYNQLVLALEASNPGGTQQVGEWRSGAEHYVGFRLGTAPRYRYGWLRLQAAATATQSTLTVTEYAIQTQTTLPVANAVAQPDFFAGANPVQNTLRVHLPTAGTLCVYDMLGRQHFLLTAVAGSHSIDSSAWPPGHYVAYLITARGRSTQRIQKK